MSLRELGLRDLEREIEVYRQSTLSAEGEGNNLPELEAYWTEALYRADRFIEAAFAFKSRVLADRLLAYLRAGWSPEEIPRLRLRMNEPIVDLRRLQAQLPVSGKVLEERGSLALSVAEVVIGEAVKVQTEVSGAGSAEGDPCWPLVMLALCNGYSDFPVSRPRSDSGGGEDSGPAGTLADHMWRALRALTDEGDAELAERVQNLKPSLRWDEVLYHFLCSLEDHKGDPAIDQRRREMGRWNSPPSHTYCLDCRRLFPLAIRNPGHFICSRCNTARRQRRRRQR